MSNVVIPKEQLTAYQRWELASFDLQQPQPDTTADTLRAAAELAELERKTQEESLAAELEAIRQQAHQEGYAAGLEAGYQAGTQQGVAESAQIHALLEPFQQELNQIDAQVAQSLLDLALEIARKMVLETLKTNHEVILKVVSEAIGSLPHFNQNAHLILHPEDAELVRKHMGEHLTHAGWKLFTDEQIERGGCRVETAHSRIDASNEGRWQRIVEAIGQDKSWLA